MKVSLKYYTVKYLTGILLLIIAIWAALFYAFILDEVYDNVDDGLRDRKIQIVKAVYIDRTLLENKEFGFNEFKIKPISKEEYQDQSRFYNKMFYMEYDDKEQPYRILETDFVDQFGKPHQLIIRASTVEQDELVYDLTIALVVLYLFLVVSIILVNGLMFNKAMKPFYQILNQLKKYQFGSFSPLQADQYKIKEFEELNTEVNEMIERNELVYFQQKQFIENASHELQTPLAIVSNKIDYQIQNENLDENNFRFLNEIKNDLRRMAGLNKSLLMLSKIENNQYNRNSFVNFNSLLKDLVQSYEDFILFKEIKVKIIENSKFEALFDVDLAEILMANFLKNAIKYNNEQKIINITIEEKSILFENSGNNIPLEEDKIFGRFYKQSTDHSSTGLGLAINKTIIKQYPGWNIAYEFINGLHRFRITKS